MQETDLLRKLDPCAATALPLDTEAGLPGFGDPWHAQAFGTAMALARSGLFDWARWVETFSVEIRANPQRPGEASEAAYYRQWLAALETIIKQTGALAADEIAETAEHWRRSYLNTPHGKPIELSRSWDSPRDHDDDDHDHHHDHHHQGVAQTRPIPVAIDPARSGA